MISKKKKIFKEALSIVLILIGCIIMGISYNMFNAQTGIVLGGMAGFSIVLEKIILTLFNFDIPFIYIFIFINAFLFLFGFKVMGKKFFLYSLIGTVGYIVALKVTVFAQNFVTEDVTSNLLLCAIFGGVTIGCGAGLIFRCGGTTGGTDIIGCMINHKRSHINIGTVAWIVNGLIVVLTMLLEGVEMGLYGLIYIFLNGLMVNTIMNGDQGVGVFYITTRKGELLSKEILFSMGQKVTMTHVESLEFPNEDLQVLSCVLRYRDVHKLKSVIYKVDEKAFIYSCKVNQAFNEGFRQLDDGANIFTKMQRFGKLSAKMKCQYEIMALKNEEPKERPQNEENKQEAQKGNKKNDKKE